MCGGGLPVILDPTKVTLHGIWIPANASFCINCTGGRMSHGALAPCLAGSKAPGPQSLKSSMSKCSKLIFGNISIVIRTHLFFFVF